MKKVITNFFEKRINKFYIYDEIEKERLHYGFEVIYLSISKLVIILLIAYAFGTLKESLFVLIIFSIIRLFAYGIHMDKSYKCYILSIFSFVVLPKLFINFRLDPLNMSLIFILCLISMFLYAPADTHNKPLINKNKRFKYKSFSIIITVILGVFLMLSKKTDIKNIILLSVVLESILINPVTYKIFKLPYNNYRDFKINDRR